MRTIQIAICDDEKQFIEKLDSTIREYCDGHSIFYTIDTFENGSQLLDKCEEGVRYDIVYLDINMDGMNGIQIARKIRQTATATNIIFSTAFIKYAIEGYQVDAIRYLLKTDPKYRELIIESLDAVFEKINYKPKEVMFKFREGSRSINLDKLLYTESSLHTLTFFMENGDKYTMYGTINGIIGTLSEDFVRIHQSFLVNIKHVRRLNKTSMTLDNGYELPVARAKFKEVSSRLAKYEGML